MGQTQKKQMAITSTVVHANQYMTKSERTFTLQANRQSTSVEMRRQRRSVNACGADQTAANSARHIVRGPCIDTSTL